MKSSLLALLLGVFALVIVGCGAPQYDEEPAPELPSQFEAADAGTD